VTCTPEGRPVGAFVADAKARVAEKINFPAGVYAEFGGAAEAEREARQQLLLHSSVAAVGILLFAFHGLP